MPRILRYQVIQPKHCQLCQRGHANLVRPEEYPRLWLCPVCTADDEVGLDLYARNRLRRHPQLSRVNLDADEERICLDFFKILWRSSSAVIHTPPSVQLEVLDAVGQV